MFEKQMRNCVECGAEFLADPRAHKKQRCAACTEKRRKNYISEYFRGKRCRNVIETRSNNFIYGYALMHSKENWEFDGRRLAISEIARMVKEGHVSGDLQVEYRGKRYKILERSLIEIC